MAKQSMIDLVQLRREGTRYCRRPRIDDSDSGPVSSTMKIAFLPDYFLPHIGGMQIWTHHVAVKLAERGHRVTVFTYRTPHQRSEEESGYTIRRVGYPAVHKPHAYAPLLLSRVSGLPGPLLRERFDSYLPTYGSLLVSRALGAAPLFPVWHGFHGLRFGVETKGISRGVLRTLVEATALRQDVQGVIAVSEHLRRTLMAANLGLEQDRVHVVHGGVDAESCSQVTTHKKANRVLFMGRMVPGKGAQEALQAFLQASRRVPDVELLMVGTGSLLPMLAAFVGELDPETRSRIHILGELTGERRLQALASSRLLLHPSLFETFPLTPLEALACGTTFLGYDIPALLEIKDLTKGGILVPAGDISSLAEAMTRILETEGSAIPRSTTRRIVLHRFSWENSAKRLEKILSG